MIYWISVNFPGGIFLDGVYPSCFFPMTSQNFWKNDVKCWHLWRQSLAYMTSDGILWRQWKFCINCGDLLDLTHTFIFTPTIIINYYYSGLTGSAAVAGAALYATSTLRLVDLPYDKHTRRSCQPRTSLIYRNITTAWQRCWHPNCMPSYGTW